MLAPGTAGACSSAELRQGPRVSLTSNSCAAGPPASCRGLTDPRPDGPGYQEENQGTGQRSGSVLFPTPSYLSCYGAQAGGQCEAWGGREVAPLATEWASGQVSEKQQAPLVSWALGSHFPWAQTEGKRSRGWAQPHCPLPTRPGLPQPRSNSSQGPSAGVPTLTQAHLHLQSLGGGGVHWEDSPPPGLGD